MNSSPTMQDVANRARVSRMTVSRALRDDPKISLATRQRVQQLAAEMGYRTNALVSALMSNLRQTRSFSDVTTLAFVTSMPTRSGWREIAAFRRYYIGAQKRALQLGYRLDEFWLREKGVSEETLARVLRTRNIPGVMIAPTPDANTTIRLPWDDFAFVAFGYSMNVPPLYRATNHQHHSILTALRRLRALGYRRIGLCMPAGDNDRVDRGWLSGLLVFQDTIPRRNRVPHLLPRIWTLDSFSAWYHRHKPDAVISISVRQEGKLVKDWLDEIGAAVPAQVGFALLDWSPDSGDVAGIDQNSEQIGMAAVDLLVEQLHRNERGLPSLPKVVYIEGSWRDGPTAPPRCARA